MPNHLSPAPSSVQLPPRTESWILEVLEGSARVISVTQLTGGLSGAMFLVDLVGADVPAVVLRNHTAGPAWKRDHVRREAAALELLAGSVVGAPELIASDVDGEHAEGPATLMTVVPGTVELDPADRDGWLEQLAERLAAIHDQPPPSGLARCEHWADLDDPDRQAWLASVESGPAALELARGGQAVEPTVFSHGDYQHFNVLWGGGRLSGVVDWTMAGVGDSGKDVGHCMLNLAVLFSPDLATRFLDRYEAITGARVDPGALAYELVDYSPDWARFLPKQVMGRVPVDVVGMTGRVNQVLAWVVRRAG